MWKPPQRIKYKPLEDNWPSVEDAGSSRLFSPVSLGSEELEQRTWIPAMVPWRASDDGFVTEEVLDWYGRFARGRPGAIVVEATGIRDVPSGPLMRIGHDRFTPGLEKLVERVRQESGGHTRLLIQIIDFLGVRRRPEWEKYLQRFLRITDEHRSKLDVPDFSDDEVREKLIALDAEDLQPMLTEREWDDLTLGHRERVTDTEFEHIAELPRVLPDLFANAALRAKQAGFHGVELHYAHAYTMSSFLSATNTREDGYGGSLDNRLRLPLEVFKQVRSVVGQDYPVGCRFLSEECIEGGTELQESCQIGAAFAEAGMDFLSLSRGGKFDDAKQPKVGQAVYPYTGVSGFECMPGYIADEFGPYGRNMEPTAAIHAAVRASGSSIPVVVAGGIHTFSQAEALLQEDKADIIGIARQALADPDWFEKVRTGCGCEVRQCEYTNYCEGLDQKHKQVTCNLWDRAKLDEPGILMSSDGKRRLTAPGWKANI